MTEQENTAITRSEIAQTILGLLIAGSAAAHVANSTWPSFGSLQHIRVGVEGLVILIVGIAVMRGWGFRD